MDRYLWEASLSSHFCPPWPCVSCKRGQLRLRKDSLVYEETASSKREQRSDDWLPEAIEFTFAAWAQCANERCAEGYAIVGTGFVEQEYSGDDEGSTEWVERFYPRSIMPTLQMISLPEKCPPVVKSMLFHAFACYWAQADASAGRIRAALEALLTHVGIPAEVTRETGKPAPLSLHRRIELYAKQNPVVGQQLMAIKWLGNTGSHGSEVTRSDILDALELLEHALTEMLDQRSEKMVALARKLAERHGPSAMPNTSSPS
jgi:hypothetical protein